MKIFSRKEVWCCKYNLQAHSKVVCKKGGDYKYREMDRAVPMAVRRGEGNPPETNPKPPIQNME